MLVVMACAGLCLTTVLVLRGGLVGAQGRAVTGTDAEGVAVAALALFLAAIYLGPLYGIAIFLSMAIHEFGHVAAYRIAGHRDAQFRLVPFLGSSQISEVPPKDGGHDLFIHLMGAGLCVAPMALAFVGATLSWSVSPGLSDFLWAFALTTGAINAFVLLPFWPLDGGRCATLLLGARAVQLLRPLSLTLSAALAAAAVYFQSLAFAVLAVMALHALVASKPAEDTPAALDRRVAAIGGLAWLATFLAHLWGGWALIIWAL